MREVEILICEIIPAGIADFAVNHRDLAMVAIVKKHVEPRHERIKNATLDSDCFEFFGKRHVDEPDRSHIVIKNANLNACFDAFFQNRLDLLPGFLVLDCMVFHEDEVPGKRQIMELRIKSLDCFVEIFHLCIFINGISRIFVNILGNSSAVRIFDAFTQILEQLFVNFIVASFHFLRSAV